MKAAGSTYEEQLQQRPYYLFTCDRVTCTSPLLEDLGTNRAVKLIFSTFHIHFIFTLT